ncbi:Rhodanese-like domain-containing protein 19 [Nymphaea thermarum]|nr:Rhodanese-like domain-containing protein 19 [Nymphaea thermarum]
MAAEQHKEATSAKVNGSAETGSADISKLVCGRRFRDVSNEAVVTVNVYAAKDLLATGHCFLDVRTKEEFSKGHVKNAINVPYVCLTPRGREKNPTFLEEVSGICSKDGHIIVSCNGGGRSSSASADLRNAVSSFCNCSKGFKNVKSLGGGFRAWVDSGFDVESPEGETTR